MAHLRFYFILFFLPRSGWGSWDPCGSLLQPKTTADAKGTSCSSITLCNTMIIVLLTVRLTVRFVQPLYCLEGIVQAKMEILTQKMLSNVLIALYILLKWIWPYFQFFSIGWCWLFVLVPLFLHLDCLCFYLFALEWWLHLLGEFQEILVLF